MNKLPEDFVNRIRTQLGDEADIFLDSFDATYVKSLRFNLAKNPNKILPGMKSLGIDSSKIELQRDGQEDVDSQSVDYIGQSTVSWESRGIYYKEKGDENEFTIELNSPGKSPLHSAGAYYIQEASAMLPVTMLDITGGGLKVLDLCAAPGGKTTQIADYMQGEGILICNEIVPSRAKILSENIERMGVRNALVISSDPNDLVVRVPRFFDRILVDAPCSGEGMFRKHPEARDEWSLENVKTCADRQDMILDCASQMLAPGGKIVYSTCTFSEEEDEGSVERFLFSHPDFIQLGDGHRLFPHKDRGEGHFAAAFTHRGYEDKYLEDTNSIDGINKSCNNDEIARLSVELQNVKPVLDSSSETVERFKKKNKSNNSNQFKRKGGLQLPSKVELDAFKDFCKENLKKDLSYIDVDRILMFGDRMFLVPDFMPDISGLTVLRPGLHLGTIIKDRFEPSHAWALTLKKEEVCRVCDFAEESGEIASYLKGMTLNCEGGKGWCLICVEGLSLGWGKINGGIIKNHYPKGLRIMG